MITATELIDVLSQATVETLETEDTIKLESVRVKTSLDEINHQFLNIKGPREKAFDEFLQSIHVLREAYFGGTFVGNMCVKILDNYSKICEFMEGSAMKGKHQHLIEISKTCTFSLSPW